MVIQLPAYMMVAQLIVIHDASPFANFISSVAPLTYYVLYPSPLPGFYLISRPLANLILFHPVD